MKRPIIFFLISYLLGILVGQYILIFKNIALFFLTIAFLSLYLSNKKDDKRILFAPLFFILAIFLFYQNALPRENSLYLAGENREDIEILAVVEDIKKNEIIVKNVKSRYHNKDLDKKIKFSLDLGELEENIEVSDLIFVTGKIKNLNKKRNISSFDEYYYYKSKKIESKILVDSIEYRGKIKTFNYYLKYLNRKLSAVYDEVLPEKEAGLVKAMVLGNSDDLDQELSNIYKDSGISHILVISGMHISIFILFIYKLLSVFKMKEEKIIILTIIFSFFYLFLTGFASSAIRAVLMATIGLLASLIYRESDIYSTISLTALIVFIYQPLYLFQAGVILSFSLVLGLVLLNPLISDLIKIKGPINNLLSSSISAFIVSSPLVVFYFYKLPTISLFVNILAVPLSTILLITSLLTAVLGVFSIGIAKILAIPVLFILKYYEFVSSTFLKFKFSTLVIGKISIFVLITFYLFLLLLVYAYRKQNSKEVIKFAYLSLFLSFIFLITPKIIRNDLEIHFLDVGQGDACIIKTKEKQTILIDSGGYLNWEFNNTGKSIIKPFLDYQAIKKIDKVFISHPDADHMAGLLELIDLVEIGEIYFSDSVFIESDLYDNLIKLAKNKNIAVRKLKKSDMIDEGKLLIEIFYPLEKLEYKEKDYNKASLVFKLSYDSNSILFSGDISKEDEAKILENNFDLNVDIIKLAHHGSKNSNSTEFLKATNAKIALCGNSKFNAYGHPHKETLERLENQGIEILDTGNFAAIEIIFNNNKMTLKTMKDRFFYEQFKSGY